MSAIDKIRKLLALARDEGATEHEAARALELASQLMAKHGVEESSLEDRSEKVGYGSTLNLDDQWKLWASRAAATLYSCRIVITGTRFEFVGRPTHTTAAETTYDFIVDQVERSYKAFLPKGLSKSERAEFRRSFKKSCAYRLAQRAHEIIAQQATEEGARAIGCNALVLVSHRQQLESEAEEFLSGFRKRRSRAMTLRPNAGTLTGLAAADSIKLQREVGR